jgi:TrmH family RNA methyltransferase
MLTSTSNPKVKHIRRLQDDRRYRRREGAFVVEGSRWITELILAGRRPQLILASDSWLSEKDNRTLISQMNVQPLSASDAVMARAGDTQTSPGVLAVVSIEFLPWPQELSLVLVLDRMTNPGNLGSELRSASAAGIDGVLLSPGCVDPFNPKVLRGAMGAQMRLPIMEAEWVEIERRLNGMSVWLATIDGAVSYEAVNWRIPSAIIIGSEASGAGHQANSLAGETVRIPMSQKTESLNASVAASVIMLEAARQRRQEDVH